MYSIYVHTWPYTIVQYIAMCAYALTCTYTSVWQQCLCVDNLQYMNTFEISCIHTVLLVEISMAVCWK